MKKTGIIIGVAVVLAFARIENATAQIVSDAKPFRIIAQASAGLSLHASVTKFTPPNMVERRTGLATSLRLFWHPDHLLSVGIESGWSHISSIGYRDQDPIVQLTSIPLFLVFRMEKYGVDISTAFGWHRYTVRAGGSELSSAWEMGYAVSFGYTYPLTTAFGIGAEVKFETIPEREIGMLMPLIRAQYAVEY